jgi:addiction module RelE/StbE family toxin
MEIYLHKNFLKQFKKLPLKIKKKFIEIKKIFLKNPFDKILNNHSLKGKYKNYRSININNDYRVIYKIENNIIIFIIIEINSELY